jgi:hypothetical protein
MGATCRRKVADIHESESKFHVLRAAACYSGVQVSKGGNFPGSMPRALHSSSDSSGMRTPGKFSKVATKNSGDFFGMEF